MVWFIAAAITIVLVFLIPNFLVWNYSNNQKNPLPRATKSYFLTRVEPNHAKLVMRGGVSVRLLLGSPYAAAGDNLSDHNSWKIRERASGEPQRGGKVSLPLQIIEGWIFFITGYRFVARTVAEIFSSSCELFLHKISRENFKSTTDRPEDITDHVVIGDQEHPWKFSKAETQIGGEEVNIAGQQVSGQGVPFEGDGTYLLRITDLWRALFGIEGDYLKLARDVLEEGARELIQSKFASELLSGKAKNMIVKELTENLHRAESGKEGEPGALGLYGFMFPRIILKNLDPEGEFRKLYQQRAAERTAGEARLEKAQRDKAVAEVTLEIATLEARGKAAQTGEELKVIGESAATLSENLGQSGAAHVLAAQQAKQGAENAEHATFITQVGHPAGAPLTPTFPVLPNEGKNGGRDQKPQS